jgi:hypothetical protein
MVGNWRVVSSGTVLTAANKEGRSDAPHLSFHLLGSFQQYEKITEPADRPIVN